MNTMTNTNIGVPASGILSMSRMGLTVKTFVVFMQNRWAALSHRKQVKYLAELDDYLLQDIGLKRDDLRVVRKLPITMEPTRFLESLATERRTQIKV